MKASDKNSIERTFLSKERNALSKERTVLSYIRTELAIVGIIAFILKFYFEEFRWSIYLAIIFFGLFGILILFESFKIRNLRKKRHEFQKKHLHLDI